MTEIYRNHLQVKYNHYFNREYDYKGRFCTYWHQIDEIISNESSSILEIGIGNKFVSNYISERGINVTSIDIDRKLFPTILGSVFNLPFMDNSFETVSCCEVLEHSPYSYFPKAIFEIFRITERYAIISLPDSNPYIRIEIKIPKIKIRKLIENPLKRIANPQIGEHYWEIGNNGYPLQKIIDDIEKIGFSISKTYRIFEDPYHRFFILEKK